MEQPVRSRMQITKFFMTSQNRLWICFIINPDICKSIVENGYGPLRFSPRIRTYFIRSECKAISGLRIIICYSLHRILICEVCFRHITTSRAFPQASLCIPKAKSPIRWISIGTSCAPSAIYFVNMPKDFFKETLNLICIIIALFGIYSIVI